MVACGGKVEETAETTEPTPESQEVNLYSHRHYDTDKELYKRFTEKTGIKVNVVKAKADQLIERLSVEGDESPADLLLTVDVGRLHKAKSMGLLQPVESEVLEANIPEHLHDSDHQWFSLTKRARVVVYNIDTVKPEELSTYEDLADPKWKGRILTRSSTNIYNQSLIASLIANNGEEATEAWAKGLVANFARNPKGNDRAQMRSVAAGEGDLAIVNTYYLGKLVDGDEADQEVAKKIAIFFPNQDGRGTHINVSGIGLTKSSKNKANAIKLMEFLSGEEAQKVFAQRNYEYPVKEGIASSELVAGWGEFKEDQLPLPQLGENGAAALQLADRAGWK